MKNPENSLNHFSLKKKLVVLAALIAVATILLSAFWVIPEISRNSLPQAVKPVIGKVQPASGYYLSFRGNITRIFVVSTNLSSGFYPYPTRSAMGQQGGPPVVEKGEPCVIINVTVRNDYSAQYPPPAQFLNNPTPAFAYVFLTAKIFSGNNEINATDLTQVGLPPDSLSFAGLNGGETATISIYLATTSKMEITSFQIVPVWIGGIPLP
ncbi:MAG: hypothetical protein ABSG33_02760 [Candidatus Bathyarchaeia archaeon]|jgi:hypothetical protein